MQTGAMPAAIGALVYWKPALANRAELNKQLHNVGLNKYMPAQPSPKAIMRQAVIQVCQDSKNLVRPTAEKGKFTVVNEQRGEDQNYYQNVLLASVGEDGTIECNDYEVKAQIEAAFKQISATVSVGAVSDKLATAIEDMKGVALKSGSLYYIPEAQIDHWKLLAEAFEGASNSPDSAIVVNKMRQLADEGTVRAVRDGLQGEFDNRLAQIADEINEGKLKSSSMLNRASEIKGMLDKLTMYENELSLTLDNVKARMISATSQLALAVFGAAGGDESPLSEEQRQALAASLRGKAEGSEEESLELVAA